MEGHTERRALCTLAGRELLPTMTSERVGAAACVRRRSHEEVPIMGHPSSPLVAALSQGPVRRARETMKIRKPDE